MYFLDDKAVDFLNIELGLTPDEFVQDWDIEMADDSRIMEFISYYNNSIKRDDDRFALIALIIASYEDYLYKNDRNIEFEEILESVILERINLFIDILNHWALKGEKCIDNIFKITIFIRGILDKGLLL